MFAKGRGVDYLSIRKEYETQIYQMFAFSSAKKRMNTLVWLDKPNTVRMYTKGAPEMILEKCQYYMNANGEQVELTDQVREELAECQQEWASKGYRTLSLSYKDMVPADPEKPEVVYDVANEEGSTLLCLFGIEDPLRPEVAGAVATCQKAGIIVRMVTGDNIATGSSIARQCKIISNETDVAIEGPQFAKKTDEEIIAMLPHLRVIARCSPQDKERLVRLLKEQGEVVAVTGDGTNDVPALKEADVGLAMGLRGTDVAKQASDIVILDDNFQSIVKSVKWGRCVYDNIRKFLQFQLTVNVSAVGLCIIGSVFIGESPLNALQMLWVNMIMDTLAALALGTEKPTDSLLDRKPFGRYDSLISPKMFRAIISQTLFQFAIILPIVFAGKEIPFLHAPCGFVQTMGRSVSDDFMEGSSYLKRCSGGHKPEDKIVVPTGSTSSLAIDVEKSYEDVKRDTEALQTLVFNMFVFAQIFNLLNSRKVNGEHNVFEKLFTNLYFLCIVGGIVFFQVIIVVFLGVIFEGTPFNPFDKEHPTYGLSWQGWILTILSTMFSVVVAQIVLFIPVPQPKPKKFKSKGLFASLLCCCKNKEKEEETQSILEK